MKLDECLTAAGLRDLRAFTDAWQIDVVKRDEPAEYVNEALDNALAIRHGERVERHLSLIGDLPYRAQMLAKSVLRQLLNQPGYIVPVDDFHAAMIEQEREFVEWARRPNALRHLDAKVVDIYRTVLEAAWEDNVNSFEYRLLERLRAKLGLTRRDHRVIELQIGKFPSVSGGPHTTSEIEDAVRELIKRGLAMRVPLSGRRVYAIPEELAVTIRDRLGIELTSPAYGNLLKHLPVSTLRLALEKAGQPFSGTRDFLTARIIDGYASPKFVLRQMSDEELAQLVARLPLIRQDGSREIRIRNVVRHFDRLTFAPEVTMERQVDAYVSYYADLASRNYAVLRAADQPCRRSSRVNSSRKRVVRPMTMTAPTTCLASIFIPLSPSTSFRALAAEPGRLPPLSCRPYST